MLHRPPLHHAVALLRKGRYEEVLDSCRPILAQQPGQFAARHLQGVALLRLGRLPEAEQALRRASRCRAPVAQRAQASNSLALCLQHQGRLAEASAAIDEALRQQPGEAAYWLNRGNILEARGDWSQMQDALQQALRLDPGLVEARIGLAVARRHLGRLDEARDALDASPEQDYDWLCEYVLVLLLQGETDAALELSEQVPDSDSLQGLADYVAEAGQVKLAEPIYRGVLAREPGNAAAVHMLASLQGLPAQRAPRAYVEALYDQHAAEFEQRLQGRLGYRAPELMTEALAKLAPESLPSALDLGCGSGLLGRALKACFATCAIDGIDLSSSMLALARAKGCYRNLRHGDAVEELAKPALDRYPLIASTDMLIYLGDLEPLFDAMVGRLVPDGLLALTVEAGDADRPQLQPSGRFRHGAAYLERLADDRGLRVEVLQRFDLRREHDQMIEGLLLILRAPATTEQG